LANPSKSIKLGSYVRKVGYFDIRQKIVQPRKKKNHRGEWETIGGSVEINLFHAKNKVGGPYKSHKEAEDEALGLLDKKFKYTKPKK
jgi:hypothetical protein